MGLVAVVGVTAKLLDVACHCKEPHLLTALWLEPANGYAGTHASEKGSRALPRCMAPPWRVRWISMVQDLAYWPFPFVLEALKSPHSLKFWGRPEARPETSTA